jgi:hypothetical protein
MLAGCLEVNEEIHIKESGEAKIAITLKGDMAEFNSACAIPSGGHWYVDTLEIEEQKEGKDEPSMTLRAERVVKPGQAFPHTFSEPSDPLANKQLRFPTEVKVWSEGKRTFYEFKRTYLSRRHSRFIGTTDDQVDEDLEKRVMENGIFNVSESDRTIYLNMLSHQFQLQMIGLYEEAMGEMVIANRLRAEFLGLFKLRSKQMLEELVTPETVLTIVSLPDDSMGIALDALKAEVNSRFITAFREETAGPHDLTGDLRAALDQINLEWEITENLDNDVYSVDLYLPGVLIKTNGTPKSGDPGAVGWKFEGNDLHDRSIGLYALSVVEQ